MSVSLHMGDCLEVMPTLPSGSVDMILADLPYGTTACKWDTIIPLVPLWEQYKRLIKRNGAIVLTASQPFTSALVMSNPKWFRYGWVWIKNRGSNFAVAKFQPLKEHEDICVFYGATPTYNPQMQERTGGGLSRMGYDFNPSKGSDHHTMPMSLVKNTSLDRFPSTWQKFNTEVGHHPTQKPVALMEYLIRTYTNEGETVLDNTMGSGTTGVACVNTNRNFIGIEKDAGYFAIAEERIQKAQQAYKQAELITA